MTNQNDGAETRESAQDRERWLDLLDALVWAANSTEPPSAEDRDYGPFETPMTLRARHPADFDDLAAWLDVGDHAARLGALADALVPSRVDRLRCCRDVEPRLRRWRDPLGWRDWRDAALPEFEQRRADLLAIVDDLRRRIEGGAHVPPAAASVSTPAVASGEPSPLSPANADGWYPIAEAARRAGLTTETVRGWVRRDRDRLPAKRVGAVLCVRLADVIAERDAKAVVGNPLDRPRDHRPPSAPKFEKRDTPDSRRP